MEVDAPRGVVTLSRIFKWYGKDFAASKQDLLRRVASEYLPAGSAQRRDLENLLANPKGFKVTYAEYNWDVNSNE